MAISYTPDDKKVNLKTQVVTGIKWLAFCKFFGQVVNWGMTLVVIRLVSPFDYGLMAMAMAFVGLVALVNEMGIGASIVQAESLDEEIISKLFGLTLAVNIILFIVSVFLSPFVAIFYGEKTLSSLIMLLSFQFLVGAFCVIPKSLLERELNFKVTSIVEFFANTLSGVVALFLAFLGYGVWALAWGAVSLQLFRAVFLNFAFPSRRIPKFAFSGLRSFAWFGGVLSAERLLWYLYTQADIFILGKIFGADLVGIYSVAKHLSSLPMQKIAPLINQIVMPAFSRIQSNKGLVAHNFIKGVRLLSFLVFPVFIGMAAVSDEIVQVVLGDEWKLAGPILGLLCFVMPLAMLSSFVSSATKAIGKVDVTFFNMVFAVIIMPFAIILGSKWGINGVGIAWLVGYPVVFMISLVRCSPSLHVSWTQSLSEVYVIASLSLVMFLSVKMLSKNLGSLSSERMDLFVLVLAGIAIYLALLFVFRIKQVKEFVKIWSN